MYYSVGLLQQTTFTNLTDTPSKDLLYAEQQKLIEDDMLPAGVFGEQKMKKFLSIKTEIDGIQKSLLD